MQIGTFKLDTVDYASQGNAILGIRDSGKTYTATWIAERLLDQNIPFVAFDPIGVWRYLRVGKGGFSGYKVVVAGDDGDLPLTAESAPNIVRAAMQENIPLVLDLYSMSLSKAQWKTIVERSVDILFYENKPYGLRHVFIEEAAEFCPQRIQNNQGRVYAVIERLARMGRNSSLGYTLINQRAEEVNKAVLELCDCLFLHRQKGRNSLTALSKWLDIADASGGREIIKSLPTLEQGTCWVWPQGSSEPQRIRIPHKSTEHPDPKNPEKLSAHSTTTDVSEFILRLTKSLQKQSKEQPAKVEPKYDARKEAYEDGLREAGERAAELEAEIVRLNAEINTERKRRQDAERRLETVRTMLRPEFDTMQALFSELGSNGHTPADASAYDIWMQKLVGKRKDMLQVMIDRKRLTRTQLAHLVGMAPTSGTFDKYLSNLRTLKLVSKEGEYLVLNEIT